jgi:hypothetical protein
MAFIPYVYEMDEHKVYTFHDVYKHDSIYDIYIDDSDIDSNSCMVLYLL